MRAKKMVPITRCITLFTGGVMGTTRRAPHALSQAVADVLQVSATWLRFGQEVAASIKQPLSAQEHMLVQQFRRLSDTQRTHVLLLVQSAVDSGAIDDAMLSN